MVGQRLSRFWPLLTWYRLMNHPFLSPAPFVNGEAAAFSDKLPNQVLIVELYPSRDYE